MNTKVDEGKLISGKEALIALANGIEVPKSSDTYSGGLVWILCGTDTREYTSLALDENDELPAYFWRTEEEIKQVVAALRQIFGGSHDN